MKINIALVGSGYWGKNFLKHLTSNYDKFNFIGLVVKSKELREAYLVENCVRLQA